MRNRLVLLLLPTLLVAGLAAFSAPTLDDSPLAEHMEGVEGSMKRLRRSIGDPEKRAECLELVTALQRAAIEAKAMTPAMTEKQPEADRPAFVAAYRKTMVELMQKSLALESALIDGEQEAIDSAYKQLRAMEDSGHERFTEDG